MAEGRLQIQFRSDPEFMAMLAEIRITQQVAIAAMHAHNEIRHNFTRARLRLGVDQATPNDIDLLHARCFRQAMRLKLIGGRAAEALIEIVEIERESFHA